MSPTHQADDGLQVLRRGQALPAQHIHLSTHPIPPTQTNPPKPTHQADDRLQVQRRGQVLPAQHVHQRGRVAQPAGLDPQPVGLDGAQQLGDGHRGDLRQGGAW